MMLLLMLMLILMLILMLMLMLLMAVVSTTATLWLAALSLAPAAAIGTTRRFGPAKGQRARSASGYRMCETAACTHQFEAKVQVLEKSLSIADVNVGADGVVEHTRAILKNGEHVDFLKRGDY